MSQQPELISPSLPASPAPEPGPRPEPTPSPIQVRSPAAAYSALACACRALPARHVAHVHRAGCLLCSVVAHVLGSESALRPVSRRSQFMQPMEPCAASSRAWAFEFMDRVSRCDPLQKQVSDERRENKRLREQAKPPRGISETDNAELQLRQSPASNAADRCHAGNRMPPPPRTVRRWPMRIQHSSTAPTAARSASWRNF